MRRVVTTLTAVAAVVAFSSMVFAQAAATKPAATAKPAAAAQAAPAAKPVATTPATPVAKPVAAAQAAPAKVKAAKPLSAKGEGKYDEATKTLTVGEKVFTLAPDAKIMMGAKVATIADVAGKNVMVTYTVVDGKNVASKVTIPAAKAPKAEKK
jgi:hypothetical protein